MSKVASIRLSDLVFLAASSLRRNHLRSFLTIGAIAIGISVMMYLIALGLGLEQLTLGSVAKSSALLSMTVNSGSEKLQPLDKAAVQRVEKIPHVSEVLPQVTLKGQMSLEGQNAATTIVGVDPDFLAIGDDGKLVAGHYFQKDETQSMVVTTGFLKLFGLDAAKTPLVVFTATLDKDDYPGLDPLANLSVRGIVDSDAVVAYLPRSYLEGYVGSKLPNYDQLKVTVASLNDIQPVSDALIAKGFKVSRTVDTVDEIKRVFFWIQAIMASLGLIAVLVASVGMFNTLTISLLERTREIGIMKALGIRRVEVGRLFLTESILMGLIGGLVGVGMAYAFEEVTIFMLSLLASLVQGFVPTLFLNQWYVVLGFLLFALFISVATGIYPARRAARINPIEAIRYE